MAGEESGMTERPYKNILLADRVYERLENDIIFGRYAPGQVLTELGLAEELGVSRTPVREAMRRLTQERLIADGEGGKGSVVLGITKEDVRDIMNIRLRLEGLASYYAARNITPEGLEELRHIVELQNFYTERRDPGHIKEMDDQFHVEICRQSGRHVLADTLIPLHKRIQKYRRTSIENPRRSAEIAVEHRKIYEAIAARDAEEAARLTEEHLRHATESIMGEEDMQ